MDKSNNNIMQEFLDVEAILKGHFILSSGLHSDTYIQCAKIQMFPKKNEKLCALLAQKVREQFGDIFDIVVSPAMGGVVIGYEMARQLGIPGIFCERVDGAFTIRRGFNFKKGAKVLVVEDVVTTGKSSRETFECIKEFGGEVVAEAAFIDRSNGKSNLGIPLVSLLSFDIKTFEASNIPEELKHLDAVKPGSRFLSK